jgi:hypothetical protein
MRSFLSPSHQIQSRKFRATLSVAGKNRKSDPPAGGSLSRRKRRIRTGRHSPDCARSPEIRTDPDRQLRVESGQVQPARHGSRGDVSDHEAPAPSSPASASYRHGASTRGRRSDWRSGHPRRVRRGVARQVPSPRCVARTGSRRRRVRGGHPASCRDLRRSTPPRLTCPTRTPESNRRPLRSSPVDGKKEIEHRLRFLLGTAERDGGLLL